MPSLHVRESLHFDRPVTPLFATTVIPALSEGFTGVLSAHGGPGHALGTMVVDGYVYTVCHDVAALTAPRAPSTAGPRVDLEALAGTWEQVVLPEVFAAVREARTLVPVEGPDADAVHDLDRLAALLRETYARHYEMSHWMATGLGVFRGMLAQLGVPRPDATAMLLLSPSDGLLRDADAWTAEVATLAARDAQLRPLLAGGDARALVEALLHDAGEAGREFRRLWPHVQHRPQWMDVGAPTLGEDPTPLHRALRDGEAARAAFDEATARATARRREAEDLVRERLPPERRGVLDSVLRTMRRLRAASDTENFLAGEVVVGLARRAFLRAGARLVALGWIQEAEDVRLLEFDELRGAFSGGGAPPAAALAARAKALEAAALATPPDVIGEVPPSLASNDLFVSLFGARLPTAAPTEGGPLHGVPASPGVSRGRVRVADREEDLDAVRAGDVLVVASLAPTWTAATRRVAAIVAETGGVLCHAAVVAREMGVPAVTGAAGACRRFRTGDLVEVDGDAGVVRPV